MTKHLKSFRHQNCILFILPESWPNIGVRSPICVWKLYRTAKQSTFCKLLDHSYETFQSKKWAGTFSISRKKWKLSILLQKPDNTFQFHSNEARKSALLSYSGPACYSPVRHLWPEGLVVTPSKCHSRHRLKNTKWAESGAILFKHRLHTASMGLKKKFGDLDDKTVGKSWIFLHFSGQKNLGCTLQRESKD